MIKDITHTIISKALEIHRELGPGLLEKVYQECLFYELRMHGFDVQKEILLPIKYKQLRIKQAYRIDLLVENNTVLELKSVDRMIKQHHAQILTYMKLGKYKYGLLMNFNSILLKDGIKRFIM